MYPSNVVCPLDTVMYPMGDGTRTGSINLLISGGTSPYSFSVTLNGVPYTTQQFSFNGSQWVLPYISAGTYTIVVTDSANNTATVSTTLTQPSPIVPNATITPPQCANYLGLIRLSPTGGTSPYSYLWSTGSSDNPLVAVSGTYSVVVTDTNGCGASFSYIIPQTQPQTLQINQSVENGTIVLAAQYNCSQGTVLWSTGETTNSIEAQVGNTYTVTLSCPYPSDPPASCTVTATITVSSTDSNYWCCLAGLLNNEVVGELNGEKPCNCNNAIALYCLIQVAENSLNCLSAQQQTAILSKINSYCNCKDC